MAAKRPTFAAFNQGVIPTIACFINPTTKTPLGVNFDALIASMQEYVDTFAAMPAKVRDYVIKTTSANIRDWTSGTPFEPPLSAYHRIAAKTLVVRGGNGHPAMMRIAELLAETLPESRLETIMGGSHFLPATHPAEIARLIDRHLQGA